MDFKTELMKTAKDFGIKMSEEQAGKFEIYKEKLLSWNEKFNLTAITDDYEVMIKHFIDSISVLKVFEIKQGASLIDIGSGAGFPAIPLKIMREDLDITLLDGSSKRLQFTQHVAERLDFEITTVHKRAEEAGRGKSRESYDIAISRAVARLNVLAEYCIPLVKMKGSFIAMKGVNFTEELDEGKYAIRKLGAEIKDVAEIELPNGDSRSILIAQKRSFTPKEYPRHGGTITKHPLIGG